MVPMMQARIPSLMVCLRGYRTLIPDYVKDYVSLNHFVA